MTDRNLAWHRRRVAGIINFSDNSASQDFAGASTNGEWDKVDDAINEAQRVERNLGQLEGGREAFKDTQQFTWAASTVNFTLPAGITRESIMSIYDVTDDSAGFALYVSTRWTNRAVFFKSADTLQWGITGPGRATTLEFTYLVQPIDLKAPASEADWLSYEHRDLLNWSAACILRDIADEQAPLAWIRRLDQYRSLYHLSLSRGVPAETNPPRVRNHRIGRR